jgi:hypothetical protein
VLTAANSAQASCSLEKVGCFTARKNSVAALRMLAPSTNSRRPPLMRYLDRDHTLPLHQRSGRRISPCRRDCRRCKQSLCHNLGQRSGESRHVFQLTPPAKQGGAWTETTLHAFSGGTDGSGPGASLIFGKGGGLYSTTAGGGSSGKGTIFKIVR